ncbi:SDR family oxidoreductase [Pseudonocardia kujensis]|uniref:SDR family NAD(P)-dependent oxidoreductase n=1 Tax=Pseudonocardia kujensis TaxID=1128675 RepID=UPI001E577AD7|nr:SDR family oxidoreductase [Pseudonocardia kujensis]MCE0765055.1 SDR family oxidoreductase [Pseudonocardia kujensis]
MGTRLGSKTALVTGAAGALGGAVARSFADEGVERLVLVDLDPVRAEKLAGEDWAAGVDVIADGLDVTDGDAYDALVARIVAEHGSVDVVVNAAGNVSPYAPIHELSTEDFEKSLRAHLTGTFHTIRAVARAQRGAAPASIVAIASVAGMTVWPNAAPYSAAKAGVIQLSRVAAREYAEDGIRVNAVCPGTFLSSRHEAMSQSTLEAIGARHPLGFGSSGDITGAIVYLACDESRWVTGHALVVDGGCALG